MNLAVHGAIIYASVVLFNLKLEGNNTISSKIGFTKGQFDTFLKQGLLLTTFCGLLLLGLRVARSTVGSFTQATDSIKRVYGVIATAVVAMVAVLLFLSSTVPLHSLHKTTNSTVNPDLRHAYTRLNRLQVISDHVYYHKIQPNGRLEIILEGSNNIDGPWLEYNFLYKPGNVNNTLPYVGK